MLSIDDAMHFFKQFPGHEVFYKDNELGVMLDCFVHTSGNVEFAELFEAIQRVYRYKPELHENPNKQGIHKMANIANKVIGSESWSPIKGFATFSEDGTVAVSRAG